MVIENMQAQSSQALVDLQATHAQISAPGQLMDVTGESLEIESSTFGKIFDGAGKSAFTLHFSHPPHFGKVRKTWLRCGDNAYLLVFVNRLQ